MPKKKPSDTLFLALNKPWFDMIKSGVKTEEYREIKPSYISRFYMMPEMRKAFCPDDIIGAFRNASELDCLDMFQKKFKKLVLTCGYPSKSETKRRLVFNNPKLRIDVGKPEWGAEPNTEYFVITWDIA